MSNPDSPLFRGSRDDCLAFLRTLPNPCPCVLRRPERRPCRVGRGAAHRLLHPETGATHPDSRRSKSHQLNLIRSATRAGGAFVDESAGALGAEPAALEAEERPIARRGRLHEGGAPSNRDPGGGSSARVRPASRARHPATPGGIPEDAPETAVLNRFVPAVGPMRSVMCEPRSRFAPRPMRVFERKTRAATSPQAVAPVAWAAAGGILLDGPAILPRKVVVGGVEALVEQGISRAFGSGRPAVLSPAVDPVDDCLQLETDQCPVRLGLAGRKKRSEPGLLQSLP